MPLYDFQCDNCLEKFELSLTLAEREKKLEKKQCPKCSSQNVKQLMTFSGAVISGNKDLSCNSKEYCPSAESACCPTCPSNIH